jgi:hypothetical protein
VGTENRQETEESVSNSRAGRIRLEDKHEWHWEKVDESYCLIKNPLSDIMDTYSLLELNHEPLTYISTIP